MIDADPRPHTTVVLAMSADGKIADTQRSPARFGSSRDKAHLEAQIARSDGVLFGAGTLRAYGTTLRVSTPALLAQRQQQGKPEQPIQIVCSRLAEFSPTLRFFQQPVPRWLLTTEKGAHLWQNQPQFERILTVEDEQQTIDWRSAFAKFAPLGLGRIAVLGGGELVGSLVAMNLIDEIWLTVCPLLLGGADAPTPVQGAGFLADLAPKLELLSVETVEQEVFLHYRVLHSEG